MGTKDEIEEMTLEQLLSEGDIGVASSMKNAYKEQFGVLDAKFLSQSVGLLNTPPAVCVRENDSVQSAIDMLRKYHIGCILVSDDDGKLVGIFSERDIMEKVICSDMDRDSCPISQVMTRDPVSIDFTVSMGYGLSLMSMGGFRHLPIVDNENYPLGVVSVKDIVNHITNKFVEDLGSLGV